MAGEQENQENVEGTSEETQSTEQQEKKMYDEDVFKGVVKQRDELKSRLRQLEADAEKRAQEELEKQGEYKELADKYKRELEEIKPIQDEYTQLKESTIKALVDDADRMGLPEEVANAIITNSTLSFDERAKALRSISEKRKGGSPDGAGKTEPERTEYTQKELMEMSPIDRVKAIRAKKGIK